ncbi:glycosyltransferase family 4 protein [Salinibacter ruber]|uniref:glycosyltransferase family 4 protein n=1 Tax=Salinibacter ruber TaxID=146919 RepID=UPI00216741BC|nr:glycosyltransferase family 4 protein [Salinibacter ruber]MCS4188205.1 glycosyltransferase involved in cell wall biosynthesis [Salinibacter ruber]
MKLGVVTTHPIQYQIPIFKKLSEVDGVKLVVYYDQILGPDQQGQGFSTSFEWDLPLLEGYPWKVCATHEDKVIGRDVFVGFEQAYHEVDVMLVHGWQTWYMRRAFWHGLFSDVPLLVRGDTNAMKQRPPWIRYLQRWYLRGFDRYLYVGEENKKFYRQAGVPEEHLFFAPRCVENERFSADWQLLQGERAEIRADLGVGDSAICFLFCGKFTPKKRPRDVVQAFLQMRKDVDHAVHLLMVGDGPLRSEVVDMTPEAAPVTFTGFLNQTEIGRAYTAADVIVLPSDYGETWGLVINEGMIFELPAIVSDRVGCGPDLVDEGETGRVFPFGDVQALRNVMGDMAEQPEGIREMGTAARRRVCEKYTPERVVEGILEASKDAFNGTPEPKNEQTSKVLVTHSGRQHSHQLAEALADEGNLAGYWTGVPAASPSTKGPLYRLIAEKSPQPTLSLPDAQVKHNYVEPVVRRIVDTFATPGQSVSWNHRASRAFDWWCALNLPEDIGAVVCYETGALHTFREAKKMGVTTILDAASFHHEWQDAVYDPPEPDRVHTRITKCKDAEIRLADHVLTVSELARDSYVEAGVLEKDVSVVPMGTDLSEFAPPSPLRTPSEGTFTFIFVGHAGRRKGADVLLEASNHLQNDGHPHRLQFAGDVNEELFQDPPPPVELLGYLGEDDLVTALRQADVLILPSRHDSFGRVVVEGMATGLPVILSENVGAKQAVSQGRNGWIVPAEDPRAVADRMRWCITHPDDVADMQESAVSVATEYTWTAYRRKVKTKLREILRQC